MELCSGSLYGYWQEEKKMTEMEVKSALNDMLRVSYTFWAFILHPQFPVFFRHSLFSLLSILSILTSSLTMSWEVIAEFINWQISERQSIWARWIMRTNRPSFFGLPNYHKHRNNWFLIPLFQESSPEEFGDGRYAAPEILNGEFSLRADLFSLSITISQVSVPADAPLCADEWKGMKEDGKLPERVAKGWSLHSIKLNIISVFCSAIQQQTQSNNNEFLSAHSTVAEKLQSMLLPLSSRPSVEEIFDDDFSSFEECKFEVWNSDTKVFFSIFSTYWENTKYFFRILFVF